MLIYSVHLGLLAAVNLALWLGVRQANTVRMQILRSALALAVFVVTLAVAVFRPRLAVYGWVLVLLTPLLARVLPNRLYQA